MQRAANDTPDGAALARLVDRTKDIVRARPLTAVGAAAALGYMAGSRTPRLLARPLGALAFELVLTRVFDDASAS